MTLDDIARLGIDINASGINNHRTALTAAAFAGNSRLIRELVQNGADVDHYDNSGLPAILEAAAMGWECAVQTLLELALTLTQRVAVVAQH